jgi:hypothetical protein
VAANPETGPAALWNCFRPSPPDIGGRKSSRAETTHMVSPERVTKLYFNIKWLNHIFPHKGQS